MRRSWPSAREFVVKAGWDPVEVPVRLGGRPLPPLVLYRDPIRPDLAPAYLHEAESREDWRRWIVRSVMES